MTSCHTSCAPRVRLPEKVQEEINKLLAQCVVAYLEKTSIRWAKVCQLPSSELGPPKFHAHVAGVDLVPTGNLTFSGVVFRLNGERAVLHTRETGDQSILLRADTRYLHDGVTVEAKDLKPNTRVYIRAGKNLYDEVEAYQIVWGSILTPR